MKDKLTLLLENYWLIETTDNTFYKKDFYQFKTIEEDTSGYFKLVFENLETEPEFDIYIDYNQAKEYIDNNTFYYILNDSNDDITFETFHKDDVEITEK